MRDACIFNSVIIKTTSRVPTDFDLKRHARLDFIGGFNANFEKCTYDWYVSHLALNVFQTPLLLYHSSAYKAFPKLKLGLRIVNIP